MDVDALESGPVEGGGHLDLSVDPLLAQDRQPWTRAPRDGGRGRIGGRIEGKHHAETGIAGIAAEILFLIRALGVVPQRLHAMSRLGPGPSKLCP